MKHFAFIETTDRRDAPSPPLPRDQARYSDRRPGWRSRLCGMGGTAAVYSLILGLALAGWRTVHPVTPPTTPLVFNLLPLATLPEPVQEIPEGPRQTEQARQRPIIKRPPPPPVNAPHVSPPLSSAETAMETMEAAEQVTQTTAPKSLPAPPANSVSNDAERSWEAVLLAHLERFRRYPSSARARREQGVAYVSFRMNRSGQIMSVSIGRSSGSRALDQAALDTIRRAQPLPAIPDDKPDELDLSVPVSFFVSQRK